MALSTLPRYDERRVPAVGERAPVAGASAAGLLAGRVLADGFREGTIVDRDPLPDGVLLEDDGPGIPPSERETVFE